MDFHHIYPKMKTGGSALQFSQIGCRITRLRPPALCPVFAGVGSQIPRFPFPSFSHLPHPNAFHPQRPRGWVIVWSSASQGSLTQARALMALFPGGIPCCADPEKNSPTGLCRKELISTLTSPLPGFLKRAKSSACVSQAQQGHIPFCIPRKHIVDQEGVHVLLCMHLQKLSKSVLIL